MESDNSKSDTVGELATVSNNSGESSADNYELLFLIVKVIDGKHLFYYHCNSFFFSIWGMASALELRICWSLSWQVLSGTCFLLVWTGRDGDMSRPSLIWKVSSPTSLGSIWQTSQHGCQGWQLPLPMVVVESNLCSAYQGIKIKLHQSPVL